MVDVILKIGINLHTGWPFEEIIEAFVRNGIERTFVCIEHPQFEMVMDALKQADIVVDNFHAPYEDHNHIWKEGEQGEKVLLRLLSSVDICVRYNVKLLIVHASNGTPMPPITEIGLQRFDKFMAYAKKQGVTVAYESHRFLKNVQCLMERYPEAGFCLDTGHEDAFTSGLRYMPLWGNRLVATHISDNECSCGRDMHMLPFDGHIDFEKTAREIAESCRDVVLMLEVKPSVHNMYANISVDAYYDSASEKVKKLAEMVESHKCGIEKQQKEG